MKPRTAFLLLVVGCLATSAHDVISTPITFAREISRLLYKRCASCHRDGGSAFPLVTYNQARPWAKAIKEEVLSRRMPPWGAVKGFGEFRDETALTQEQIELIADWVEGGAPEGDASLAPKLPDFSDSVSAAPAVREIVVDGALTLDSPLQLAGIVPKHVAGDAGLMVTAARPDGSIEPLLWLYEYNPKFAHAFLYAAALRLPRGTKVQVTPADAGTVALLAAR